MARAYLRRLTDTESSQEVADLFKLLEANGITLSFKILHKPGRPAVFRLLVHESRIEAARRLCAQGQKA